jgi:DNA-binding MarR family transcriptional regulator
MKPTQSIETSVEELISGIGLLVRRIRAAAPSENRELSWTQLSVISRLDKEGPATIADLARAEGVKPQSMGAAILEMEEKGLVLRQAHPTDGRQFLIKLSAKGAALRKNARASKRRWLSGAIDQLDKQDQIALFKAGRIIKRLAEQ